MNCRRTTDSVGLKDMIRNFKETKHGRAYTTEPWNTLGIENTSKRKNTKKQT